MRKWLSIVMLGLILLTGLAFAEVTVTAAGETKVGYMASDLAGHDYLAKGFRLDQDLNISFGEVNTLKTEFYVEGLNFQADSLLLTSTWAALLPENAFIDEVLKPVIDTDVGFDIIPNPVGALRLKAFDMIALEQSWKWDPYENQYKILARGYLGSLIGIKQLDVAAFYDSAGDELWIGKVGTEIDVAVEIVPGILKVWSDVLNFNYVATPGDLSWDYDVLAAVTLFDGIVVGKAELLGETENPAKTFKIRADFDPILSVLGLDAGMTFDLLSATRPIDSWEASLWATVEKATFRLGYLYTETASGAIEAPVSLDMGGPFGVVKVAY